jgi:hypothetical protein
MRDRPRTMCPRLLGASRKKKGRPGGGPFKLPIDSVVDYCPAVGRVEVCGSAKAMYSPE